jgi:heme-degrading monooxygenase HmoA
VLHVNLNLISEDPDLLGESISYIEATVRPAVEHLRGNLGMSLHADRQSGALVLESFWASRDELMDGENAAAPGLAEDARRGNGTVAAQMYDVPVFVLEGYSAGGGEAVQLNWMDVDPSKPLAEGAIASSADTEVMIEDAIASFGDSAVPSLAETAGFRGALLYAGWDSRRLISETIWRDTRALAASRSTAVQAEATGCMIRDTHDYRLVFSTARTA